MPVKLVDRKVYADGIPWDIFPVPLSAGFAR